jgi:hypothetical protein
MKRKQIQYYDVFNGDADGICALHQLRMAEPRQAKLITGVKRDIKLLQKIADAKNAVLTVLDISLDSNRPELITLLERGCKVSYFDHHFAGDIPPSENLEAHIDPDPDTCTSLIVDRFLHGKYRAWAVAGAFGDNQHASARDAASSLSLSDENISVLKELGELLNYNGYGVITEDLHIAPDELYKEVHQYEDPLEFYKQSGVLAQLQHGFHDDMNKALSLDPFTISRTGRVFRFPNVQWARRVAGVFVNQKAREEEDLANALLVDNGNGTFMASVRAPLTRKKGADALCRKFPTGGGRAAAAGINALPENLINDFLSSFDIVFQK